jgi:integrase
LAVYIGLPPLWSAGSVAVSTRPRGHPLNARSIPARQRDDALGGLYVRPAVVAGARRGELLALRWCDVELEAAVLTC